MISWGPPVRPLHESADFGGDPGRGPSERGFGITLDGLVPLDRDDQARDGYDGSSEQDPFDA